MRYFVDERIGCIAVRDRNNTDPDYNGLHSDTEGVVGYWQGTPTQKTCPTCGHKSMGEWTVSDKDKAKVYELCDKLNKQLPAPIREEKK